MCTDDDLSSRYQSRARFSFRKTLNHFITIPILANLGTAVRSLPPSLPTHGRSYGDLFSRV